MNTQQTTGFTCHCGRVCKSKGGLTQHKRACREAVQLGKEDVERRLLLAQVLAIETETALKVKDQEYRQKRELESLMVAREEAARKERADREDAARKERAEREEAARKERAEREEAARKERADREESARKDKLELRRLELDEEIQRRDMTLKERCLEEQLKQSGECVQIYKDYLGKRESREHSLNNAPGLLTVNCTLLSSREMMVYGTLGDPWVKGKDLSRRFESLTPELPGTRAIKNFLVSALPELTYQEAYNHPSEGTCSDSFVSLQDWDHVLDRISEHCEISDSMKADALESEQQNMGKRVKTVPTDSIPIGRVPKLIASDDRISETEAEEANGTVIAGEVLRKCERSVLKLEVDLQSLIDNIRAPDMREDVPFWTDLLAVHARLKLITHRLKHERVYQPDAIVRYAIEQDLLVGDGRNPAMPSRLDFWVHTFGMSEHGRCASCSRTISRHEYERGHVVAAKRKTQDCGGSNAIHNLQAVCQVCNGLTSTADAVLYADRKKAAARANKALE
jgi:5-methylcytosine-specific restriction endonuclease McrA